MKAIRVGLLVAGVMSIQAMDGCGGKISLPFCPQMGNVTCKPSTRDLNKLACSCTCRSFPAFTLPVCLPASVNSSVTPQATIDAIPQQTYDDTLTGRCNVVATALNNLIPAVIDKGAPCSSGGYCSCTPTAGSVKSATACLMADASCATVLCTGANASSICMNPFSGGGIDLTKCPCTVVDNCGGGPTPKVCPVSPGNGDPPGFGVITETVSGISTLTVDPSKSTLTLDIGFSKAEGGQGTVQVQTSVSGAVKTYGRPRSDGSADVLFDFGLQFKDKTFTIDGNNVALTKMVGVGGMGDDLLSIGSNTLGEIPTNAVKMVLEFNQNGSPTRIETPATQKVPLSIDYKSKTFTIPFLAFMTNQGVSGSITLSGTITNQAPVAVAGQDQTLECTSPAGASAKLDGSASFDADNNIDGTTWRVGETFPNINAFAGDLIATTTAPIGTTTYQLAVEDQLVQVGLDTMHVTVRDTTAPTLTLGTPSPTCLWPPNHKLVVYELGKDLPFKVTDTCDPNPIVTIVSVVSNQPDLGGGQGDFTPDILSGSKGLCLRSEREGTSMADRTYTITIRAADRFGNFTDKKVVVTVPHDEGMAGCPKIDPARLTDANDPRCTAN